MDVHPLWYICLLVRFLIVVAICQTNIYLNHKYVSLILFLMGAGFVYKGYFSSNNEMQIAKVFGMIHDIYMGRFIWPLRIACIIKI